VRFDVPVCVYVSRLVLLDAGNFDLLEAPLRQVDVSSTQIAAESGMLKPERGGQSPDLGSVSRSSVVHNFDGPVIFLVANCGVPIG